MKAIRVLYVEDEPNLASIVQDTMRSSGYEVLLIEDGAKVIEAIPDFEPDICLLDVMLPNKDGFEVGEELSQGLAHVTNACGKYNLDQSASIISQSNAVITSDTGMMHIAAALKKRVFMMWGNTVPAFGMGPYKTKVSNYEVEGLSCRPCSKLGKNECPKGHFKCMINQDLDKLLVELNQEL